jgi:predicted Zn-dependent peptidase
MTLTMIDNHLDEKLLTGTAASGLRYILNPKPGFSKTMGVLGIRFGSTDNAFMVDGRRIEVPEGTAHFLEHKLFEDKQGDVSDRFNANGASCNAGTGFNSTSYLFSCTEHAAANAKLLLEFVQSPYFTAELIEKEQGIIGQEIKMYNDDPDWVVFFNLMKCIYREHPVRQNIAGSVESIRKIDPEVLERCYSAFYRPGNMVLVMAGRLDPEEMSALIEQDGAERAHDEGGVNQRSIVESDTGIERSDISQAMIVARPKVLLGFKDLDVPLHGRELQAKEFVSQILMDLLFGKSSENYDALYDEGIIDESFSAYFSGYTDFGFASIGGDTDDPELFRKRILEVVKKELATGIDAGSFARQKNKYMGKFIRTFNSIESTAFSLVNFFFKGLDPTAIMEIIEGIRLEDMNRRLQRLFDPDRSACSLIEPMAQIP